MTSVPCSAPGRRLASLASALGSAPAAGTITAQIALVGAGSWATGAMLPLSLASLRCSLSLRPASAQRPGVFGAVLAALRSVALARGSDSPAALPLPRQAGTCRTSTHIPSATSPPSSRRTRTTAPRWARPTAARPSPTSAP